MKNSNKKRWIVFALLIALVVLAGCQANTDAQGHTLPERIIYLTTPWKNMMSESIFTAILVYPLAQCINFLGKTFNSGVMGVVLTTILFNVITLGLSIKSTVSTQKMQMLQPELQRIQDKYADRKDDNSQMLMAQEMNRLYAKNGINPLGSMLTPFLQFPIMIAMYYAAQRADVVANGTFMGISLQTTPIEGFMNLKTLWPIAMIFIVMLVLQVGSVLIPQELAKRRQRQQKGYKAYADDSKSSMASSSNVMMFSTLILIGFLGIRWPAAMSVYWAISSLTNIVKTLFIQRRYIDNEKV